MGVIPIITWDTQSDKTKSIFPINKRLILAYGAALFSDVWI
jgi:hypothetical protein